MRVYGTAACGASLRNLTRAFLAFPMTNKQWIKPAKFSPLRYADAPWATSDASKEICSCSLHLNPPISRGKKQRCMRSWASDGSWLTQDLQLTRKPSPEGWSQYNFLFQMSCIRALAVMVSCAAKPGRSHKEQMKNRIPHFVSGRIKSFIWNPSSFVSTNHRTTKALSEGNSFESSFSSGVNFLSEGTVGRTLPIWCELSGANSTTA